MTRRTMRSAGDLEIHTNTIEFSNLVFGEEDKGKSMINQAQMIWSSSQLVMD